MFAERLTVAVQIPWGPKRGSQPCVPSGSAMDSMPRSFGDGLGLAVTKKTASARRSRQCLPRDPERCTEESKTARTKLGRALEETRSRC